MTERFLQHNKKTYVNYFAYVFLKMNIFNLLVENSHILE